MKLLEHTIINTTGIKNRILMAPMTRSRANNADAAPTEIHTEYYTQRSTAGLIITEGTVVTPQGVGYINVPGIYSDKQTIAWKKVTDAVHEKGGKIFVQLWHVGRMSHPDFHNGQAPVAPSAINANIEVFTQNGKTSSTTPKELTIKEIKIIVYNFKSAGENAMKAGFDGVEIHSSNGYLFHQFFNNCSNQRTDIYGETDENKARFLFEVIDALKEVVHVEKIGVRLNPMLHGGMGITVDEQTGKTFDYIISRLNNYNLAYLHLSRPWGKSDAPYFIRDVIGHYRKIFKGFLIANGGYDKESAEKEVLSGRADAIAFARPFISNPDLPVRFEKGQSLTDPNPATFYTPGTVGYTDYPIIN